MSAPLNFTSSIDLPDGRRVYVSLEIPEGHPSTEQLPDLAEQTEIAQIAAATVLRNWSRADLRRVEDAAEDEAAVVSQVAF